MKKNKKVHIHEESGLQYYNIKLTAQDNSDHKIKLRLFETTQPQRLEFESQEEYKLRRNYIKRSDKKHKKGHLVWNAKWGTFNEANALRVQAAINNQNK